MMPLTTHNETIVSEFTHQAETFNACPAALAAETLDQLVAVAGPEPAERWLDAACGPGIVCRRLAPLVRTVYGIDLAPAMIAVARREAANADIGNVSFEVGDATAIRHMDANFDGGLTRFTLHHLPVPSRLFGETICWRSLKPMGSVGAGCSSCSSWLALRMSPKSASAAFRSGWGNALVSHRHCSPTPGR
jgi:ubiquinone/menaquinone biosynthesis C-methylase UbiE